MKLTNLSRELKDHTLRLTPQRQIIYDYIKGSKEHPTAEMVYSALKENYPSMSLNTVYNTLELFENLGIVMRVVPEAESARFDGNVKPHIHLLCLRCRRVFDIDDDAFVDFESIRSKVDEASSFDAQQVSLLVSGRCGDCKKITKEDTNDGTERK